MLGKMLVHGLMAAALVGSAAAVYAQAQDSGSPPPDATPAMPAEAEAAAMPDNGYLRPILAEGSRRHGERDRHDRRRERDHDDDDD